MKRSFVHSFSRVTFYPLRPNCAAKRCSPFSKHHPRKQCCAAECCEFMIYRSGDFAYARDLCEGNKCEREFIGSEVVSSFPPSPSPSLSFSFSLLVNRAANDVTVILLSRAGRTRGPRFRKLRRARRARCDSRGNSFSSRNEGDSSSSGRRRSNHCTEKKPRKTRERKKEREVKRKDEYLSLTVS